MKYIIVLGDGMADDPVEELGGRTPLQAAVTNELDRMAGTSEIGLVSMVPDGMAPGSDTANLSVLGYDPFIYYSGRSPLEALSIGVDMAEDDVSFRCNLVTLTEEEDYSSKRILDHSSDEISSEEAEVLLKALKDELSKDGYRFYAGTSYRHLLIWENGEVPEPALTAPHDILTKVIGSYLPADSVLREMMERSYEILNHHPVNEARRKRGLRPANSAWFWGAGTKPSLPDFYEMNGVKGVMISAVDLLKGIAAGSGMAVRIVDGANGGLHTNYKGKAKAAADALLLEGYDFAYIHVEAPDEMGHQGCAEDKVKAIEWIDSDVIGTVREAFEKAGEPYRMLVLPDHPTPVRLRTHTDGPVPYLLYDSTANLGSHRTYDEQEASKEERYLKQGHRLIGRLLGN